MISCKNALAVIVTLLLFWALACTRTKQERAEPKFLQVTSLAGDEKDISYSPDGAQIAFSSNTHGGRDVFVVSLATGEVERI